MLPCHPPAGVDDVTPRPKLQAAKAETIGSGYSECDGFIAAYKKVGNECAPFPACWAVSVNCTLPTVSLVTSAPAYPQGELQLQPGCNMDQSLEASLTGVLNNIREVGAHARF